MESGKSPILIVDDEEIVRESVTEWLKSGGYNAECAEDGLKALDKIQKRNYDVVVLDMKMPGMDGLQVLKKVHEINPDTKVIIITAYASVETAVQALKDGAVDYIVKPFEPEILEDSVAKWIGKPKITSGSAPTETFAPDMIEKDAGKPESYISILEKMKNMLDGGDVNDVLDLINTELGIDKIEPVDASESVIEEVEKPVPPKEQEPLPKVQPKSMPVPDTKEKYCVWMKAGLVSYRLCSNNYKCESCDFAQSLLEKQQAGAASPEVQEVLKRLKSLPGPKRLCRFALKGDVSYRLCSRLYKCETCSFSQMMEEKEEAALAKLQKRMTKKK